MPFAGNMKLNHFLLLVGTSGVLAAGAAGWLLTRGTPDLPEAEMMPAAQTAGTEVRPGVTLKRDLAPAPPTDDETEAAAGAALAAGPEHERMVLSWKAKPLATPKKKDVSKGRAFKINVYQDEPGLGVNRAKVDLDRDDQWDHKYTFEPDGGVTRKVAPADDESYTVRQRWDGSSWIDES